MNILVVLILLSGILETLSLEVFTAIESVRGGNTTLYCNVESKDFKSTTFTWTKVDGNEAIASVVSGFASVSGSITDRSVYNPPKLTIMDTRVSDAGEYRCMAITPGKAPEIGITTVTVHAIPVMNAKAIETPVVDSNGLYPAASCFAESGFPVPSITWRDTLTNEIQTNVNKTVSELSDGTIDVTVHLLLTRGLIGRAANSTSAIGEHERKRNYTCIVSHPQLSPAEKKEVTVDLLFQPSATIRISSNELTCDAIGNPTPVVTWTLPDLSVVIGRQTIYVDQTMPSLSSGRYVCVASNSLLPNAVASLNVEPASDIPFLFTSTLQYNTSVPLHLENYKIQCSAELKSATSNRNQEIFFMWSKDGKNITEAEPQYRTLTEEKFVSSETSIITTTLVFEKVRRFRDEGVFACRLGSITRSTGYLRAVERKVHLTVDFPTYTASVSVSPSWTVAESTNIELLCSSTSKPPPSFKWYHKGKEILGGRKLIISNISREQAGEYTCVASNYVPGSASASGALIVQYPPFNVSIVESGGRNLLCKASDWGVPAPYITWIFSNGSKTSGNRSEIVVDTFDVAVDTSYICQVANNMSGPKNATYIIYPLPIRKIGTLTVVEFAVTMVFCILILICMLCSGFCVFRHYFMKGRPEKHCSKRDSKRQQICLQYSEPPFNGNNKTTATDLHTFQDTTSNNSLDSNSEYPSGDESFEELKSLPTERPQMTERTRPTFSTFSTLPTKSTMAKDLKHNQNNAYKSVDGLDRNSDCVHDKKKTNGLLPADAYANKSYTNHFTPQHHNLPMLYNDTKPSSYAFDKTNEKTADDNVYATVNNTRNIDKNDTQKFIPSSPKSSLNGSEKSESQVDPLVFSPSPSSSSFDYMAMQKANQSRQSLAMPVRNSPSSYNPRSTPIVTDAVRVDNKDLYVNKYYQSPNMIDTSSDRAYPSVQDHASLYSPQQNVDKNTRVASPYDSGPDSVQSGSTGTTSTSRRLQSLTLV